MITITIDNQQIITLLKSIGNNLKIGRSIERSLINSLSTSGIEDKLKSKWIKMINIGDSYINVFDCISKECIDNSISRVWILLSKIAQISTIESGEKILEIANNLDENWQLNEKRSSLIKAQRYKIYFLSTMTSIFLGIISGLAPLFASFVSVFRNIEISDNVLKIIPFSLYTISALSVYFTTDVSLGKFSFKIFLLTTLSFIISYFILKAVLILIL